MSGSFQTTETGSDFPLGPMAARTFTLLWIHPDFNAQFCHYYDETPGDLANFYVLKETTGLGDEWLDIDDLAALLDWLEERQTSRS